jgi:hypothetical protein
MSNIYFEISIGIWPFDENAMREKVALNANTASPSTSSISPPPSNILQSNMISSISLSLPTATTLSSSTTTFTPNVRTTSSIDVSLNITSPLSSSIPQIFSQITPIQPVLVDGADGPASSGDLHLYSMLQSCPLDLTIDRRPRKRKNLTNSQTTRKLLRLSTEEGKYLYIF